MAQANIVLVIDNSSSMGLPAPPNYNYLPYAQTDANTFVYIMNDGDKLGVVHFSSTSSVIYGNATSLIAITGKPIQDAAKAKISALTATYRTNMVAGVNTAHAMIASSPSPRGIVFLSDGEYNDGGNPVPGMPTDVPFHTIALGQHGQVTTLQQMATKSGGKYHLAPNFIDLSDIYNDIVGDTNVAQVMVSKREVIQQYQPGQTSATVSAGTKEISIAVTWADNSVVYTPNTPIGNQINISLKDPNGHTVQQAPYEVGTGFVVFKLGNPIPGVYTSIAWYAGGNALSSTCGIFDPDSDIAMGAKAVKQFVSPNDDVMINSMVMEAGEPVTNVRYQAILESPADDYDQLLNKHAAPVGKLLRSQPCGDDEDPKNPSLNRKISCLRQHLGHGLEAPRQTCGLPVTVDKEGNHSCKIPDTSKKGPYIIRLRADGTAPRTGRHFSRTKRVSIAVV